jgi:hypothetical protein
VQKFAVVRFDCCSVGAAPPSPANAGMIEPGTYSSPYAFRKSSRLMPDWRQIVRNVAPLIRE